MTTTDQLPFLFWATFLLALRDGAGINNGVSASSESKVFTRHRATWLPEGAIAQLGERYNGIVEVSGSIPLSSTKSFLR